MEKTIWWKQNARTFKDEIKRFHWCATVLLDKVGKKPRIFELLLPKP